ncbi:MAG: Fic family protein [Coriobacteriia bacterium]|nr:Fic family protein [Coriobacteriia bacterium]
MFRFHITDATAAHVARIEHLREQLDRRGPLPRVWAGRTRADLVAEAASASVRLEGVNVTADEARRILMGDRPASVSAGDAAELMAYREAMALVLSRADDSGFVWQRELILAVHRSVMGGSYAAEAGRIRRVQNWLANASTGEQVFQPVMPESVAGLLDELCDWLGACEKDAPVAAAAAHVRMAAIHPFRDGNGRTARVLSSLVMYRGGYRAPQFTSLEEWWGRHVDAYYEAFECLGDSYDEAADVTPFVSAHVAAQATQAEALSLRDTLERALWTVLTDIAVHDLQLNERASHALYDALFGRAVTNRYYRAVADVSDVTAVQDLRKLVAAGLIEARGGGRTAHYVGADRLLDTVAGAAEIDPARLGAGEFCARARALVAALAHRLQGEEIREDSLPYCAQRG